MVADQTALVATLSCTESATLSCTVPKALSQGSFESITIDQSPLNETNSLYEQQQQQEEVTAAAKLAVAKGAQ